MHVGKPIVVFAGLLLAVVRPANAGRLAQTKSPDKAVVESIQPTGKFDFVKYFKERDLNTPCAGESVVNDTSCVMSMNNNNFSPCLCTVIYNMTKQLKDSSSSSISGSSLDPSDVRVAMNKIIEFNDSVAYETWKNASKVSPPMKLLMAFLNTIDGWNLVCFNVNKAVTSYCKFLNVNVWLLTASAPQIPKEFPKEHDVGAPNIKEQTVSSDKPEVKTEVQPVVKTEVKPEVKTEVKPELKTEVKPEVKTEVKPEVKTEVKSEVKTEDKPEGPKKSNDLLQPPDDIPSRDNESNLKSVDDVQKSKVFNINDDEPSAETDPTEDEELLQEPEDNNQIQSDTDANDMNLKEFDSTITHTKTKETQLMYSQTTMTKKHGFSETDDSHFLFYFSAMTILSMFFYLALYNKKKIIALLIEGRRGTNHRRRLNTATYSKVETDDGSTVF